MTQPSVTQTELDGALGILSPTGRYGVFVGTTTSGTAATPAAYGKVRDLVSAFGYGPTVEAAARAIELYGLPVVIVKCAQAADGGLLASSLDVTGVTGTSVVTSGVTGSNDDYEAYVKIVTGGTRGTAGITYRYSYDGGRTLSAITALGTDTSITLPNSGGVTFALGAGTLIAGDVFKLTTTAPTIDSTGIAAALAALGLWVGSWRNVMICNTVDGSVFDAVDTKLVTFAASGKNRAWIGNTRMPNFGESESSYKTALDTIFSARSTKRGYLHAGSCELVSSVSGRVFRRPASFVLGPLQMSVSEEINIASLKLGALPGVTVTDSSGNPKHHDESTNPGLDDSRFSVLRTWEGRSGVYPNRPRVFSAEGSDFDIAPKREVMNIARTATRAYLETRLNEPILVNRTTGYILESEAQEIEAGANAALANVLGAAPKASGWSFVLSRTDNVLSTKTLTGQTRIIPLAYAEFINEDVGFKNPALNVIPVG